MGIEFLGQVCGGEIQNADVMDWEYVGVGLTGFQVVESFAQIDKGSFGPVAFIGTLHFQIDDVAAVEKNFDIEDNGFVFEMGAGHDRIFDSYRADIPRSQVKKAA